MRLGTCYMETEYIRVVELYNDSVVQAVTNVHLSTDEFLV